MKPQEIDDSNQQGAHSIDGSYPAKTSNCFYNFNSQNHNKCFSSHWKKKENSMRISSCLSNDKNEQRPGFPVIYTSNCFHNTANLYLNKKNFTYGRKKKAKQHINEYYEKEHLFDRVMKLQSTLNKLNQKYSKKMIENDKLNKEINRQNKLLNSINLQNFKEEETKNYYNQIDETNEKKNNENSSKNSENNIYPKINKNKYTLPEKIEDENEKEIIHINKLFEDLANDCKNRNLFIEKINIEIDNLYKINENIKKIKQMFEELMNECETRDTLIEKINIENENLKKINENLKIANETLVSNLKMNCKNLERENEKKASEIAELKKNSKCSKYNELLKEKDIYEKEMNKIKKKLNDALNKVDFYKNQEGEIKKLNDIIKKKDFKIKALQLELTTLSNNSDETTQKLQNELVIKDKLIKKQEREMKKDEYKRYAYEEEQQQLLKCLENSKDKKRNSIVNMTGSEISEKYPELFQIYIEMKKKGINSSKVYLTDVLKKLNEITSLTDNKIIYSESLINILEIKEIEDKKFILNLADKEFINNKNLPEIKNRHQKIFNDLFSSNKKEKPINEIKKLLKSKEENLKKIFKKYDKKKKGYIKFSEMVEVIDSLKLGEVKEELLLFTKSELFNKMNYCSLFVLAQSEDKKGTLENINKVNNVINKNNNNENNKENVDNKERVSKFKEKLRNLAKFFDEETERYLSDKKESYIITEEGVEKEVEGIKLNELLSLFKDKNLELSEDEIILLKDEFGIVQLDNIICYESFNNYLNEVKKEIMDN